MKSNKVARNYWITLFLIPLVFPVIFMVFYVSFKVFGYRKKDINQINWKESLVASHYIALGKNLMLYTVMISAATMLVTQGYINGLYLILIVLIEVIITIVNMNRFYAGKVAV